MSSSNVSDYLHTPLQKRSKQRMTKPAFIYFQKSAHLLILVDVLSHPQRDAFIQIGGRISRGVKAVNAKSQEGYLVSSILLQLLQRVLPSREGSASKRRRRRKSVENGEEESFRVNPSFSWKPRFVEAGLSGAKLPVWRESTFLPAALLAPLGSSVAWRILCSLWMVFTSAVTRFQREIAGIVCAPFPFHAFSVRVRVDFSFSSFFFEIDEIRGMRRGGLNGWTRRRMMAGKERSLSDQSCCSD